MLKDTAECLKFDVAAGDTPKLYNLQANRDHRGTFCELWNKQNLPELAAPSQLNYSISEPNVLRGMHWQARPNDIGKYVVCLAGAIQDVVVDLRRSSSTFKRWRAYKLSFNPASALWVPAGFAHGFLNVSHSGSYVVYIQSGPYCPKSERSFRFDDPEIGINWDSLRNKKPSYLKNQVKPFVLSKKDTVARDFASLTEDDIFV